MLAALLFAGLATAALVPIVMSGAEDDDIDIDLPGDESDDLLETSNDSDGAIYDIPAVASETVLSSFDAGTDRLTLNADDWDTEFFVEPLEEGGIALQFEVSDGLVSIHFPELDELPLSAIDIAVQAGDGGEPSSLSLVEVFAAQGDDEGGVGDAQPDPQSPTDPDAPEDSDHDGPIDVVLPPIDPDALDAPPGTPVEDSEILDPVQDPEPLASLSFDGSVVGHLYPGTDGAPMEPVAVNGFEPRDILVVELDPDAWAGPQTVTGTTSEDGADGVVMVDGIAVALLVGVPTVPLSQVNVISGGPT